jgi:hypothetical protein
MSTVISVFPGFGGNPWLPGSGVPLTPLYVELAVPAWFWVAAALTILVGATALVTSSIPQQRLNLESLRLALHLPQRHRHRHA